MALGNSGFLCAAFLQPLLGYILDQGWKGDVITRLQVYPASAYQMAFATFIAIGLAALIAAIFVCETYCENSSVAQAALKNEREQISEDDSIETVCIDTMTTRTS